MAKGFAAVEKVTATVAKSKKTYLKHKNGESIKVRIPSNIAEQLTMVNVVNVFGSINTTLSNSAEETGARDVYNEAHKLMREDHFNSRGKDFEKGSQADKDSYKASNVLEPRPIFLFGVIPLSDFVQGGTTKNTYPAGEPVLLETNLGANNVNIKALEDVFTDEKFIRKIAGKAYEIKAIAANKYSFTPLDEDDLTPEELEVFNATADRLLVDEDFEGAIFVSDTEKQLKEVASLGFDITRLEGVDSALEEPEKEPIGDDDLPF